MQNGSSVGTCTRCTHVFRTFRTDSYAQSGAYKQNLCVGAQSESLLTSALLVGYLNPTLVGVEAGREGTFSSQTVHCTRKGEAVYKKTAALFGTGIPPSTNTPPPLPLLLPPSLPLLLPLLLFFL